MTDPTPPLAPPPSRFARGPRKPQSAGGKLLGVALIGFILSLALMTTYALLADRQAQNRVARASIAEGWAGRQAFAGPHLVIPYSVSETRIDQENGRSVERAYTVRKELRIAPSDTKVDVRFDPQVRRKAIYESVLYTAKVEGIATLGLPADLRNLGVPVESLDLPRAQLRFGIEDTRGIAADAALSVDGAAVKLLPGAGLAQTGGAGVHAPVAIRPGQTIAARFAMTLRGNERFDVAPTGERNAIALRSRWTDPAFVGAFLPTTRKVGADGFAATYAITDLALGEAAIQTSDQAVGRIDLSRDVRQEGESVQTSSERVETMNIEAPGIAPATEGTAFSVGALLIEPVDLYSRVERAIKYGILFIAGTLLTYLLFDLVAGVRVATAEYFLAGIALVLFFVMLLAFAEVVGFAWAYLTSAGATIGLLTAYSVAVLKSVRRAQVLGGVLVLLYAAIYTLLNLEAYALLIGSLLMFAGLAAVMWLTRKLDWSAVGSEQPERVEVG